MAYSVANNQLLRKHFSTIKGIIEIPNLIDIQKKFVQAFPASRASSFCSEKYRA